jgi:hypothetical protein
VRGVGRRLDKGVGEQKGGVLGCKHGFGEGKEKEKEKETLTKMVRMSRPLVE